MNKQQKHNGHPKALSLAIVIACMGGNTAWATPPCTYDTKVKCFVAKTPAKSAEVNANFKRLWDLIKAQQAEINALKAKLAPVSYDATAKNWKITGVDVQIVNGSGTTGDNPDGTGNLIIGYNEVRSDVTISICTKPQYDNGNDCESHGGVWGRDHRTGSHNLIVGTQNNYISYGGIVAGMENNIFRAYATVSGGRWNTASGKYSSVSGGYDNTASNRYSSVSGGYDNTASGEYSSILGGYENKASGDFASVSGGGQNTASGEYSSVSGGAVNNAIGRTSSVSGGYENKAKGISSSITGGAENEVTDTGAESVILGGRKNTMKGKHSVILGNVDKEETDDDNVHPITNP